MKLFLLNSQKKSPILQAIMFRQINPALPGSAGETFSNNGRSDMMDIQRDGLVRIKGGSDYVFFAQRV